MHARYLLYGNTTSVIRKKYTKYLIVIRTKKRKRQKRKDHNKQGKVRTEEPERKKKDPSPNIYQIVAKLVACFFINLGRQEYTKIDVSVRK